MAESDESDLRSLMVDEGLSCAEAEFCLKMARAKQLPPERKNSNTTVWQPPQYQLMCPCSGQLDMQWSCLFAWDCTYVSKCLLQVLQDYEESPRCPQRSKVERS